MPRTKQIHPRNLRGMLLSAEEKGLFGDLGALPAMGDGRNVCLRRLF